MYPSPGPWSRDPPTAKWFSSLASTHTTAVLWEMRELQPHNTPCWRSGRHQRWPGTWCTPPDRLQCPEIHIAGTYFPFPRDEEARLGTPVSTAYVSYRWGRERKNSFLSASYAYICRDRSNFMNRAAKMCTICMYIYSCTNFCDIFFFFIFFYFFY